MPPSLHPPLPQNQKNPKKPRKTLACAHVIGYKTKYMGVDNDTNGQTNGRQMYAEERHRAIVERERGEGRVEVSGLASLFGV